MLYFGPVCAASSLWVRVGRPCELALCLLCLMHERGTENLNVVKSHVS